MYFELDINGSKKPDQLGVDIFGFVITKDGTYPFGGCPGCSIKACKDKVGKSWACTARLLNEKKMSW